MKLMTEKDIKELIIDDDQHYIDVDSLCELRCPVCNKKIAEGKLGRGGAIAYKCTRCKTICRFMRIP